MNDLQRERAMASCIEAIAHKYAVEEGAEVKRSGSVARLRHTRDLEHPWPRAFTYRVELLAAGDFLSVQPAMETLLGTKPPEHVLKLFARDKQTSVQAGMKAGYRHAWSNVLLAYDLPPEIEHSPLPAGAEMRQVTTVEEIDAINALAPDYPSWSSALADSYLHDFIASWEGRPAAKAQIVTLPGDVAYAADMYTANDARRLGLGRALLQQLHEVARDAGAKTVVLIPSLMAREIRFYHHLGYQEIAPLLFMAPDQPPSMSMPLK